jgi:hypothetical protein
MLFKIGIFLIAIVFLYRWFSLLKFIYSDSIKEYNNSISFWYIKTLLNSKQTYNEIHYDITEILQNKYNIFSQDSRQFMCRDFRKPENEKILLDIYKTLYKRYFKKEYRKINLEKLLNKMK